MSTFIYLHPADPNLNKLTTSMDYSWDGKPLIRTFINNDAANPIPVDIGGNSITITGNVTIPGIVNVYSTPGDPVHVHVSEVGTSGILTVPWMPIAGNVTIDSGNVRVTQGTSPWLIVGNVNTAISSLPPVVGNVNARITGSVATTITGTNLDAFGRLRVSEPYTLFDSQNRYVDGQQFSNIRTGTATVTYVQAESSFNLAIGTALGDSVISQAYTTQPYQPGKSLLTLNTFAMGTLKANCVQRVGYFTAGNGVYFEADGTSLNLVIRSSATGVMVEDRIPQGSWNGDQLNASGPITNPSGITLNPELVQIFWSDIEWLGVGNVRAGFVINGNFIVCHTFQHANQPGNVRVYMSSATLNPRYEITNTGVTTGATTLKQICSTVISEGGLQPLATLNYVSNGTNTTRIGGSNTVTALSSIRVNPSYPDAVIFPAQLDLLLIDVRYGQFMLIEGATFSTTWSSLPNSTAQYSIHSNVITDGTVIYAGLTSSRDTAVLSDEVKKRLQLKRDAAGNPITLTLAVSYTQTNTDLLYKFGWEEITN